MWLALDDSLKENGALQVIPGTSATHLCFSCKFMPLANGYKKNFFNFCSSLCPVGSHCAGMLPHHLATRPGNMLSVNQEIPEELVQTDEAVFCPLLAGQMSVSLFIYYRVGLMVIQVELIRIRDLFFTRFMMDSWSMPVMPTHPR